MTTSWRVFGHARRSLLIAASACATATGLTLSGGSVPTGPARAQSQGATPAAGAGNYAEVNGLRMYYEVHGAGEPLVLLHGA